MSLNAGIYDINLTDIDGEKFSFSKYRGKVILVVNVASKCAFTPQYEELESLYKKYKDKGFVILAFPSNEFANQEPAQNTKIKDFCLINYGVSFPIFEKTKVNGDGAHPLYKFLKKEQGGFMWIDAIKWNFTKFLIDRDGNVIDRYAPQTSPSSIESDIKGIL